MTPAEAAFKAIVRALLRHGIYPSPKNICIAQGKRTAEPITGQRGGDNLNGRETKWRAEILEEFGYTYVLVNGAWRWEQL